MRRLIVIKESCNHFDIQKIGRESKKKATHELAVVQLDIQANLCAGWGLSLRSN